MTEIINLTPKPPKKTTLNDVGLYRFFLKDGKLGFISRYDGAYHYVVIWINPDGVNSMDHFPQSSEATPVEVTKIEFKEIRNGT